jgi:hypothetical protein
MATATGRYLETSTISIHISDLFLGAVLVFAALYLAAKPGPVKALGTFKSKIFVLLAVLLIGLEIAFFNAQDPILALAGVGDWLKIAFICLLIVFLDFPWSRLALMLFVVAFLQGLLAIAQFWSASDLVFTGANYAANSSLIDSKTLFINGTSYLRASGTFLDPNLLGFFLVGVFFLIGKTNFTYAKLRWLLLIPLILTFSRLAIIALLIASIFDLKLRNRYLQVVAVLLLSLLLSFVLFSGSLAVFLERLDVSDVLADRFSQLELALRLWLENPLGVGSNNYSLALTSSFENLRSSELLPVASFIFLLLVEGGLVVAVSFVLLLVAIYYYRPHYRSFAVLIFLYSLLEPFFAHSQVGQIMLALFLGLILSDYSQISEPIKSKKAKLKRSTFTNPE